MRCIVIFYLASFAVLPSSYSLQSESKCSNVGIDVTSARGRVTSPRFPNNYPARQDCIWRLNPPSGKGIRLYVEVLENQEVFANGDKQCYDTVEISTLDINKNPTAVDGGQLCGSDASELRKRSFEIENNGKDDLVVEIKFKSDYEDQKKGFSIYFETLCNDTQEGDSGVIFSPNYPQPYPAESDCYTIIKASVGTGIEITFPEFRLEEQITCMTDFIVISEGYPGDSSEYNRILCRPADVSNPIRISAKIVTLHFVTDKTLGYSGFKATWKAILPAAVPAQTSTPMRNCSYTITGRTCQRWDVNFPNPPKHRPLDPHHNFCRIPDDDSRPWCYTTDVVSRWEYCDLDNCEPMTTTTASTSAITTIQTDAQSPTKIATSTTGAFGVMSKTTIKSQISSTKAFPTTVEGVIDERVSAAKQLSTKDDGVVWYYFLIIPVVILLLILIIVFVARRRRRKGEARMNTDQEASVQFNQMNWDETRPRENTYVEIPFIGQAENGHAGRSQRNNEEENPLKNGKASFVSVGSEAKRNDSSSSHDSIASAKERARKNFDSSGASTSATLPYSATDDVPTTSSAAVETPYQMASEVEKSSTEENLYQTIEAQSDAGRQGAAVKKAPPLPLPPVQIEENSKPKETKKEEKKKKGSKKFLLGKKKSSSTSGLGFGNPSYREKEVPNDGANETKNPFDSDDEDKKQFRLPSDTKLSSAEDWNSPIDINDAKSAHDRAKESHYMAPKLPIPNKNSMVTISPDIIDNNDPEADVFAEHDSLYSTPKPTPASPEFEMEKSFIYDLPPAPRPATSSFDSAKSKDSSQTEEGNDLKFSKALSQNDTDSGHSSLQDMTSADDDIDQQEYCTMSSVPRGSAASSIGSITSRKKKKKPEERKEENRVSLLYMSMKENHMENGTKDKEVYENLDKKLKLK